MVDWLGDAGGSDIDSTYSLGKIKAQFDVRELTRDGWLALHWDEERIWLKFAVLEFHTSDVNNENILVSCLFHGEGPTGSLRECRHTWWGEDGYLFYPDGAIISAALKALSEHFDQMV